MKAQIVYDKPCRIRFRCGSDAFTKELERSIHKLVMSNPWAIACEAHYENGGILIRYKEGHRAEAVELVRKLRGSDLAPVSDNQYDTEEIDRTFKSDLAKLVMQRYIRKAILPAPIGAALIVYSGLKYIAKGVSALFDGKLTVEVLDGASISACLIQKKLQYSWHCHVPAFCIRLAGGLHKSENKSRSYRQLGDKGRSGMAGRQGR